MSQSRGPYVHSTDARMFLQVVIGGRNKYLINGSNATPSRVQDLFRSVQLNVNNPHFLIMQVGVCMGRVGEGQFRCVYGEGGRVQACSYNALLLKPH